jgi:hypothetical protein
MRMHPNRKPTEETMWQFIGAFKLPIWEKYSESKPHWMEQAVGSSLMPPAFEFYMLRKWKQDSRLLF